MDYNLVPLEGQVCASPALNVQLNKSAATYSTYARHCSAIVQFHKQFVRNKFSYACKVCDRLWFEGDLKNLIDEVWSFYEHLFKMFSLLPCGPTHTPIFSFNLTDRYVFSKAIRNRLKCSCDFYRTLLSERTKRKYKPQ